MTKGRLGKRERQDDQLRKKRSQAEQLRKKRLQASGVWLTVAKVPPKPLVVAAKRSSLGKRQAPGGAPA